MRHASEGEVMFANKYAYPTNGQEQGGGEGVRRCLFHTSFIIPQHFTLKRAILAWCGL